MNQSFLMRFIGLFAVCMMSSTAAPPAWWSSGNPPVIDPGAGVNNKGPANIGQAKWMAKNALEALRAVDPVCAAGVEVELVGPGKIIPSWNAPVTDAEKAAQHAPLLIGQLKAISAPFYDRLNSVAPDWLANERVLNGTSNAGTHYPWTATTADDANKAVANIGQLKAVFSMDFAADRETGDFRDGLPDLWEWRLVNSDANDAWSHIGQINTKNAVQAASDVGMDLSDSDSNGLPDYWEIKNGLDPHDPGSAAADPDDDGLSNLDEYAHSTDPNDKDTDDDYVPDGVEVRGF